MAPTTLASISALLTGGAASASASFALRLAGAWLAVLCAREPQCLLALFLTPDLLSGLASFRSALLFHRGIAGPERGQRAEGSVQAAKGEAGTVDGGGEVGQLKAEVSKEGGVGEGPVQAGEQHPTATTSSGADDEIETLVRDSLRVVHAAHKTWRDVPNASKMRLGVDGRHSPTDVLAHAPQDCREPWHLSRELQLPVTRGGDGGHEQREELTEQPAPPLLEAVVYDSDGGVSVDSADSQNYAASIASHCSTIPGLPAISVPNLVSAVHPPSGAHKGKKKKAQRVKLPLIKGGSGVEKEDGRSGKKGRASGGGGGGKSAGEGSPVKGKDLRAEKGRYKVK
jgi:hypothetical protein